MTILKTSRYIITGITWYFVGYLIQRYCKRYFIHKYNFTDDNFKDIQNKIKTVDEVIATKKANPETINVRGGAVIVLFERFFKQVIEFPIAIKPTGAALSLLRTMLEIDRDFVMNLLASGTIHNLIESRDSAINELMMFLENENFLCGRDILFAVDLLGSKYIDKELSYEQIQKLLANNRHALDKQKYMTFVSCFISLIHFLYTANIDSFLMTIKDIRNAVKSGRMSKRVAIILIQKLADRRVPIYEEIFD